MNPKQRQQCQVPGVSLHQLLHAMSQCDLAAVCKRSTCCMKSKHMASCTHSLTCTWWPSIPQQSQMQHTSHTHSTNTNNPGSSEASRKHLEHTESPMHARYLQQGREHHYTYHHHHLKVLPCTILQHGYTMMHGGGLQDLRPLCIQGRCP
jgi:hypothetical protein